MPCIVLLVLQVPLCLIVRSIPIWHRNCLKGSPVSARTSQRKPMWRSWRSRRWQGMLKAFLTSTIPSIMNCARDLTIAMLHMLMIGSSSEIMATKKWLPATQIKQPQSWTLRRRMQRAWPLWGTKSPWLVVLTRRCVSWFVISIMVRCLLMVWFLQQGATTCWMLLPAWLRKTIPAGIRKLRKPLCGRKITTEQNLTSITAESAACLIQTQNASAIMSIIWCSPNSTSLQWAVMKSWIRCLMRSASSWRNLLPPITSNWAALLIRWSTHSRKTGTRSQARRFCRQRMRSPFRWWQLRNWRILWMLKLRKSMFRVCWTPLCGCSWRTKKRGSAKTKIRLRRWWIPSSWKRRLEILPIARSLLSWRISMELAMTRSWQIRFTMSGWRS